MPRLIRVDQHLGVTEKQTMLHCVSDANREWTGQSLRVGVESCLAHCLCIPDVRLEPPTVSQWDLWIHKQRV